MWFIRHLAAILVILFLNSLLPTAQAPLLSIGAIQGVGAESPYLNRFVNFRGVVAGRYEDENTRGDVYYTLFVQNLPETADGDPATSDGIAVFLGREARPDISIGQHVSVGGKVTEFFGLTEIDDEGLILTAEDSAGTVPSAMVIDPPPGLDDQAAYFEALESMRVAFDGAVIVAGPTHIGCGFAVIGEAAAGDLPITRLADDDPVGRVVPVLYPSDRECADIPQVKTGDRITGMAGTLTYSFDQFKIIFDSADQLIGEPADIWTVPPIPDFDPKQITLASINAEDYFDGVRDTQEIGEPVFTEIELAARKEKLSTLIAEVLRCPTLIGFQEVEHPELLVQLAAELRFSCGFDYRISHLESPDVRGIDNALLSDSRRVVVDQVILRQTCSPVPTEIVDPSIICPPGEEPLFGRPPLQVDARIDGEAYTITVNHFKSKRGGETETDLERIRQAVYLNGLAVELLAADPLARLIALGDFNDTIHSPAMLLLIDPEQGGVMREASEALPPDDRYSYNFGGVSELIDYILLSPVLRDDVGWTGILHTNTDFPVAWGLDTSPERLAFRVSDHDVPMVALGEMPAAPTPAATPTVTATEVPEPTPTQVLPTDAASAHASPPTEMLATSPPPSANPGEQLSELQTAAPESLRAEAVRPDQTLWLIVVIGLALAVLVTFVVFRQ